MNTKDDHVIVIEVRDKSEAGYKSDSVRAYEAGVLHARHGNGRKHSFMRP